MIFEWLEKIIFMSMGLVLGFVMGVSYILLGINKMTEIIPYFEYILPFILVIGGVSFFVLIRKENKIECVNHSKGAKK